MTMLVALALAGTGGSAGALEIGQLANVSHTPLGAPTTGLCYTPVLSPRGEFTFFTCQSSDVVQGEPGIGDLLRHDAATNQIQGIGLADDGSWGYCQGAELGTCSSDGVAASDDGAVIVFNSGAPLTPDAVPLIPGAGTPYVFLRSVVAQTTELLTPNPAGYMQPAFTQASDSLLDRTEVLFTASINYFGGADTNGSFGDLYIKNWTTDTVELVSAATDGSQGDGASSFGVLSPDGRYVVFQSSAGDLTGDNPQHLFNLFLRDRVAQTTRRLTFPRGGGEFATQPIFAPAMRITNDQRLLFTAAGASFTAGDDPSQQNIYLLDLANNGIRLLPETLDGNPPNAPTYGAADISEDGRYLVFVSAATNITNAQAQVPAVFVQDTTSGETVIVSASLGPVQIPIGASRPRVAMSADGSKVAFEWPTYNSQFPTLVDNEQIYVASVDATPRTSTMPIPATSFYSLGVLAILLGIASSGVGIVRVTPRPPTKMCETRRELGWSAKACRVGLSTSPRLA